MFTGMTERKRGRRTNQQNGGALIATGTEQETSVARTASAFGTARKAPAAAKQTTGSASTVTQTGQIKKSKKTQKGQSIATNVESMTIETKSPSS